MGQEKGRFYSYPQNRNPSFRTQSKAVTGRKDHPLPERGKVLTSICIPQVWAHCKRRPRLGIAWSVAIIGLGKKVVTAGTL